MYTHCIQHGISIQKNRILSVLINSDTCIPTSLEECTILFFSKKIAFKPKQKFLDTSTSTCVRVSENSQKNLRNTCFNFFQKFNVDFILRLNRTPTKTFIRKEPQKNCINTLLKLSPNKLLTKRYIKLLTKTQYIKFLLTKISQFSSRITLTNNKYFHEMLVIANQKAKIHTIQAANSSIYTTKQLDLSRTTKLFLKEDILTSIVLFHRCHIT